MVFGLCFQPLIFFFGWAYVTYILSPLTPFEKIEFPQTTWHYHSPKSHRPSIAEIISLSNNFYELFVDHQMLVITHLFLLNTNWEVLDLDLLSENVKMWNVNHNHFVYGLDYCNYSRAIGIGNYIFVHAHFGLSELCPVRWELYKHTQRGGH